MAKFARTQIAGGPKRAYWRLRRRTLPSPSPSANPVGVIRKGVVEVAASSGTGRVRVVVATTVLLSFISFWRAAAIVLSDLGSTAFYGGGIVEQAIGKSAPWFVLGVMLFSYAVRALYIESSAMFVRAGVYRVVKEAMGGTREALSVSPAFDYVLAGRSAATRLDDIWSDQRASGARRSRRPSSRRRHRDGHRHPYHRVALVAGTKGLHESSDDALRIMKITTVMVVI